MRALGAERFRATRFVTEPAELTSDGWRRYELGEAADGPLTEEEKVLKKVRDEEEVGKNTTDRRQIVSGPVRIGISEEARSALEMLGRGEGGNLVQLVGDMFESYSIFPICPHSFLLWPLRLSISSQLFFSPFPFSYIYRAKSSISPNPPLPGVR